MRVPEVRERLYEIAEELRFLAAELERRPARRRSKPVSQPMTPELRRQIALYAKDNPDLSYVEIATEFNVNPGRVSEAVAGFRR